MKFCTVVPEICRGQVHVPKIVDPKVFSFVVKEVKVIFLRGSKNPMGKLKFRTLMLITYKWIMMET
jgi:hypothetical protein